MATPSRTTLLSRLLKTLRKYYKPVPPPPRSVLEHALYGCLLENAPYEAADKAFESLRKSFFDLNEVRVSSVKELSEVLQALPDPAAAGQSIKRVLQAVFEATYSFDLEGLKKQNLGQAIDKLKKWQATPFTIGYTVQAGLSGHAVPLDRGALECLYVVGAITAQENQPQKPPAMERSIPKNQGVEFSSLLHHIGAEIVTNPLGQNLHKLLLEIAPDCKERLPKRQPKAKPVEEPPPAAAPPRPAAGKGVPAKTPPAKPPVAGKKDKEPPPAAPASPAKGDKRPAAPAKPEAARTDKESEKSKKAAPPPKKASAKEPTPARSVPPRKEAPKKPPEKKPAPKSGPGGSGLGRKKPR